MSQPLPCYECERGTYAKIKQDFRALMGNGHDLVVPDVEVLTCEHCGGECLDAENSRKIDKAREQERDRLTGTTE